MLKPIEEKRIINERKDRLFEDKKDIRTFTVVLSRHNGKIFAITRENNKLYISRTRKYIVNDTEQNLKDLSDAVELEVGLQFLDLILSNDVAIDKKKNEKLRKQINKACNSKIL